MSRPSHKTAHVPCPNGATSWGACDKAARIAIGQCSAMIEETRQCPHWGVDKVDDRPYCGQHLPSIFRAADESKREQARRDELAGRVDAYLAKTHQVGHVCGDFCEFSSIALF